MPKPFFHVSTEIVIRGELSQATAPLVRPELLAMAAGTTLEALVVDLSGVEIVDPVGLEPIVEARNLLQERGRMLRLRGVARVDGPLIRLAGLGGSLNVADFSSIAADSVAQSTRRPLHAPSLRRPEPGAGPDEDAAGPSV